MSNQIIKYILIGEPITQKVIWRYPKESLKRIRIESNQIFIMYCNNNEKNDIIDKNNMIKKSDGKYLFKISKSNIFYLILANESIEENKIFKLINKIESAKIQFIKREDTKKLYSYQENQLNEIIQKFILESQRNDMNQTNERLKNDNIVEKENINITIHNNSIDFFIEKFENEMLPFKFKIYIIIIILVILITIIFFPLIL